MNEPDLARLQSSFGWKAAADIVTQLPFAGEIAARIHPLGFWHIVLARNGPLALRLHIWPRSGRRPQAPFCPIHTHIFRFTSVVLIGEVENVIYTIRPTENRPRFRVFEAAYEGPESVLRSTGQLVDASPASAERVRAGDVYGVAEHVFHENLVHEGCLAATVVLTEHVGGAPLVLGEVDLVEDLRYIRSMVDRDSVWIILRELVTHLKAADRANE
jgi:hypothetical protein